MPATRIGLIGAGVIGCTHAAALQQIASVLPDHVEFAAVADPDPAAREQAVALFGFRESFADGHDLLERGAMDAVFVCCPTAFHAEFVHHAAERGLAIFCEKPLAMSYAEGAAMLAAVRRHGVPHQIGLVLRFSAVYTVMRALLHDPSFGEPMAVIFRDDQVFPIRGVHHSQWRADRRLTAGGTLIEHGVHDLDLLAWLFGPPVRLQAWSRNIAGYEGVEDYVAVELQFASGLQAQLVNVWHDMVQRPSNRRLEIFCRTGFVASDFDFLGPVLYQVGDGPETTIAAEEVLARFGKLITVEPPQLAPFAGIAYLLQDLSFLRALRSGSAPAPGLEVGLEAQRLAEAAYHSARIGEPVTLATFAGEVQQGWSRKSA
ncbi:MAG: Gfo/Idh/MocA family oxidoreductase [Candidatus Binatia bacterium]|nr:Gfo/Idh/MocA family oxidoreductase [Candidatus Binatia bacterium]